MLGNYAILSVCVCIDMMLRSEAWDFDKGFNFYLWFYLHHSACGVVRSFAWLPACSLCAHVFVWLCLAVCSPWVPACTWFSTSSCLYILKIFSPYKLPPIMASEPRLHSLLDILCCAMALHVEKGEDILQCLFQGDSSLVT